MISRVKYIFLSIIILFSVFAVAKKKQEKDAYFTNKEFDKAKTFYENQLKRKPKDSFYNLMYARSCYELKEYAEAMSHFELVGDKYPQRDLYLGELYFNNYRFQESVKAYQNFLSTINQEDSLYQNLQMRLKKSEIGANLILRVDDIAILDSIVVEKNDFLNFYRFGEELGSLSQEQLKVAVNRVEDKIQYATQRRDRIYNSDSINGQMDIFCSYKLLDEWSKPDTISAIDTPTSNENYPFLLLDGVTLYFASDGVNSLGGYDIFLTRYSTTTKSFLKPVNIGMPFNSPYNDYMMVIDEQQKMGWFASDRYQKPNKVIIYTFIPNEIRKSIESEDVNYISNVAQLKSYRKAIRVQSDTTYFSEEEDEKIIDKEIEFLINDSTIYTHSTQFKSDEARKQWNEYYKLTTEQNKRSVLLADYRVLFSESDDVVQRKLLTQKILDLEKKYNNAEKILLYKALNLKNTENKFLLKKQKK